MNGFQLKCYLNCLANHSLLYILIILLIILILFFIGYFYSKNAKFIMAGQGFITTVIALNFVSMKCDTFNVIWLYLGVITIGGVLLWIANNYVLKLCQNVNKDSKMLSQFESQYKVKINIVSTDNVKAFVFRGKIFITNGLLNLLKSNELKAVLAHEVYHVRNSPNKLLSSILAITSLTFKTHNDDFSADTFAAKIAGRENLIKAFRKLRIINCEKRINRLIS
jgi:heat shock protein HtpX